MGEKGGHPLHPPFSSVNEIAVFREKYFFKLIVKVRSTCLVIYSVSTDAISECKPEIT